jgi:exopolysaccharide biosynthesis polyprenyl glycosylphosphotransferase
MMPVEKADLALPRNVRNHTSFAVLFRTNFVSTLIRVSIDVFSAAAGVAIGVRWAMRIEDTPPPALRFTALFVPIVVVFLGLRSLYLRNLDRKFMNEIGPLETTVALAAMIVLSVMVLADVEGSRGGTVARIWLCSAVLMPIARLIHLTIQRRLRRHLHLLSPTLIVGNGLVAHQISERLKASPQYGLTPIGRLSVDSLWTGPDHESGSVSSLVPDIPWVGSDIPWVGSPDAVKDAILNTGAEAIIVAFSRTRDELLTQVVRAAHQHGLRVWVVPRMFDVVGERARVEHVGGLPLLALPHTSPRGWQFAVKHISDRVIAGLGLLVISPLFLTLMVLVRASSPGPIFFGQERVGRDGQVFDCLKFRTMRMSRASDAAFELGVGSAPGGVEGVDRRTKVGKILRATSMDELPQLINVLKGEMSLVGPRPERPEFVELFEIGIRRYGERHRVKAGVTGWAQVHGLRGQTSIVDRAEWDNYYIENWSLALDLKILALTVPAVVRRAT